MKTSVLFVGIGVLVGAIVFALVLDIRANSAEISAVPQLYLGQESFEPFDEMEPDLQDLVTSTTHAFANELEAMIKFSGERVASRYCLYGGRSHTVGSMSFRCSVYRESVELAGIQHTALNISVRTFYIGGPNAVQERRKLFVVPGEVPPPNSSETSG